MILNFYFLRVLLVMIFLFLQIFSLILNQLRSSIFFFDSGGFVGIVLSIWAES